MTSLQRLTIGFAILLLGAAPLAQSATFCVKTSTEFQAALDSAASNGKNDTIQLASGTYAVPNTAFSYVSTEAHSLTLIGGHSADCSTVSSDATLTVLDGQSTWQILDLNDPNGAVELHFLTLQHGSRNISSGGAMQVFASQALLANSIIRDSTSTYGVSGVIFNVTGTVTLQGNLVSGNSGHGGAIDIGQETIVAAHLINNTVVGNTATDPGAAAIVYVGLGGNVPMDASNNIFWGNTGAPDMAFVNGAMLMTNNDYQNIVAALGGGSSGNLSVDPQFTSSVDFHLSPGSPLRGIGTLTPPGGQTSYDLEGHIRTYSNAVDLGAYQSGDGIFFDGFDA